MSLVSDGEPTELHNRSLESGSFIATRIDSQQPIVGETVELFNQPFTKVVFADEKVAFFLPGSDVETSRSAFDHEIETIRSVVAQLSDLYPNSSVSHNIVLCPEELYTQRFREKIERMGDDPAPWIDWSEGDIEFVEGIGAVFCVRSGAFFQSEGDRLRFFAHELAHPLTYQVSKIFSWSSPENMLALAEGLVEADARISFSIQARSDMAFSSRFIQNLDPNQLALPAEIDSEQYDHPSFISATVSLNPGYASCLLWFYGMAISIGSGTSLREKYQDGRRQIIAIASSVETRSDFKQLLFSQIGFDYDKNAVDRNFLLKSRENFLSEFI
ncbi:hypothetical protein KBC89_01795 [Candidatus Woesebacteria bacterium]|nr:hypothetical protein [Candidatus Woesebacteria bacterium]